MTKYAPQELFDCSDLPSLRLDGRGGRENALAPLLPKWNRASEALYDYWTCYEDHTYFLELKTQSNMQWLDLGKYADISRMDRDILMMFVNHTNGSVTSVKILPLGVLLDSFDGIPYFEERGWTDEARGLIKSLGNMIPKVQIKVPITMNALDMLLSSKWQIVYEATP